MESFQVHPKMEVPRGIFIHSLSHMFFCSYKRPLFTLKKYAVGLEQCEITECLGMQVLNKLYISGLQHMQIVKVIIHYIQTTLQIKGA